MAVRNVLIGSPVRRLEDPRFLRGEGEYVGDLARADLLHAAIRRSDVAHGRIVSIDAAAARAMPGVHAVIDAAEIAAALGRVPLIPIRLAPLPELEPFGQPVIADGRLRYVGEPVAVVLADSRERAEDAAAAIVLEIEPLPVVAGREAAGRSGVPLFEASPDDLAIRYAAVKGDAAAAFRAADYIRRERFAVQRHSAVPMEPRGLLAEWDAGRGRLCVSGAAKAAFAARRMLAGQLDLPENAIDMVENDVGGGFGVRGEFYPEDFLVPFAARHTGRPVKWIEDRREHLIACNHAREADCEIEIACAADGTILGLRGEAHADMGAYIRTNGVIGPRNIAQFLSGPYRVPAIDVRVSLVLTNKTPVGTYRGPGRFEADFFRERLLDLAAADLGIDRVELRRRNLVGAAEMPYPLASISPYDRDEELDSGDHGETLERCLAELGWAEKAGLQGKLIEGRWHGLGVGCFIEGGAAGPRESARLVLEPDGRVAVHVGSSAIGQGLETVFAQIAADALEMPMGRIKGVFHGSTSDVLEGFGSYHSRAVVMGGSAILSAAEGLRAKIREAAAARLGCAPGEVEIVDGERAESPARAALPLGELADGGLAAEATFANAKHTYAYGAHAAHVAVDAETGEVEVLDYVSVEDVGRIMNPLTMSGQVLGGIVQGLGGVLLENFVYDSDGQPLAASLADYLMPTAPDSPRIRSVLLEDHPSPINPLGAKGGGEGGIVPVGGVIANAVASALGSLGVDPRTLPLSPARVWQMIEAARG